MSSTSINISLSVTRGHVSSSTQQPSPQQEYQTPIPDPLFGLVIAVAIFIGLIALLFSMIHDGLTQQKE